jgi:hypothetical protein
MGAGRTLTWPRPGDGTGGRLRRAAPLPGGLLPGGHDLGGRSLDPRDARPGLCTG